jgi:hypothetical protein
MWERKIGVESRINFIFLSHIFLSGETVIHFSLPMKLARKTLLFN